MRDVVMVVVSLLFSELATPLKQIGVRLSMACGFAVVITACGGDKPQSASGSDAVSGRAVNLFLWEGILAPNTLPDFEQRTGIKVHIAYAGTNEMLETRILAGNSGVDVAAPSADYFNRQIAAGGYQPLEKTRLGNLRNMDPELMAKVSVLDPGNAYGTVFFWGTNGIGYNEKMVRKLLPDVPLDSWRLLFDPAVAARLASCGISLVDSPVDVIRAVLPYLGRDPNSQSEEDLAAATETLTKIRPFIRAISSETYSSALANGDVCVTLGYSGGVIQARDQAREAGNGNDIRYVIPREGSIVWFQMLAVPVHPPHSASAYAFIDYMMEPKVIANITNFSRYANGNIASLPFLLPEIRNDPAIYPPSETRKLLIVSLPDSPERLRAIQRMWQKFKSGQ